jgi:hypothetical protein
VFVIVLALQWAARIRSHEPDSPHVLQANQWRSEKRVSVDTGRLIWDIGPATAIQYPISFATASELPAPGLFAVYGYFMRGVAPRLKKPDESVRKFRK